MWKQIWEWEEEGFTEANARAKMLIHYKREEHKTHDIRLRSDKKGDKYICVDCGKTRKEIAEDKKL